MKTNAKVYVMVDGDGRTAPRRIEMTTHDLKVWPEYFSDLLSGDKTFEVRKDDRGYAVGDTLRLREYAPGPDEYTGRDIERRVSYIISGSDVMGYAFGVQAGFVVMGLQPLPQPPGE